MSHKDESSSVHYDEADDNGQPIVMARLQRSGAIFGFEPVENCGKRRPLVSVLHPTLGHEATDVRRP